MITFALVLGFGALIGLVVLTRRLRALESRLDHETACRQALERQLAELPPGSTIRPTSREAAAPSPRPIPPQGSPETTPAPTPAVRAVPPPLPLPAPTPRPEPPRAIPEPPRPALPAFDWERFMGVRLFAWLGGLALFLGVAYFVKYSFDRGLIPPDLRVLIGLVLGGGLIAGGLRLRNPAYAVTRQTLTATGIVTLYGSLYSGHALYRLAWLPDVATLIAMTLVTAGAILLAKHLDAQVIALLGLAGGFITPLLFGSRGDPGWPFFLYVALLDAGLLILVLRQSWHYQATLASVGTLLMQWAWLTTHYTPAKSGTLVAVVALFLALFTGGVANAARRPGPGVDRFLAGALALQLLGGFGVAFWLQQGPAGEAAPWTVITLVLLLQAGAMMLAVSAPAWGSAYLTGGLLAFGALTAWQLNHAHQVPLGWVLGGTLAFAALNTAGPLLLRRHLGAHVVARASQVFPALGVVSIAVTLLRLGSTPFALWPTLLVLDVFAIGLAALLGGAVGALLTLLASAVVLGLGIALGAAPSAAMGAPLLWMIALVSAAFVAGGGWLRHLRTRLGATPPANLATDLESAAALQLPVMASVMPFLLMAQAAGLVPLAQPLPLLAVATLITALVLAVSVWLKEGWLPLGAVLGNALVGHVWWWHSGHLTPAPGGVVAWAVLTAIALTAFPFLAGARAPASPWPWTAAALAALPAFHLTYRIALSHWPNPVMGLLPLGFATLPAAGFLHLLRARSRNASSPETRASGIELSRLAWMGGSALFLVTVALPVQFERQWLTLGFALEGAALVFLFLRVPHPGLRLTGVALLTIAAVRLLSWPLLFEQPLRGPWGVLNTWLYTFTAGIVATLLALRWLAQAAPSTDQPGLRAWLGTLVVIEAFTLLNLQIATFFTPLGEPVRLELSGNFARDMTYTVGWSLFALGLVVAGIRGAWAAVRWAGLGLLAVAVLKLFLHDLARLDQLYRVGALIGVALMAITASVLYQKFFGRTPDTTRTPS